MFALLLLISFASADKVIGKKLKNYNYHFYQKDVCYTNIWNKTNFVKMTINSEGKIINETHLTKECKDTNPVKKDISADYEYHELPKHTAYCVFYFTNKGCTLENAAPNLLLQEGCTDDPSNNRSWSYKIENKNVIETCVKGNGCTSTENKQNFTIPCDVCSEHKYTYADNSTVTEYLKTYCKPFFEKKNGSAFTSMIIAIVALFVFLF